MNKPTLMERWRNLMAQLRKPDQPVHVESRAIEYPGGLPEYLRPKFDAIMRNECPVVTRREWNELRPWLMHCENLTGGVILLMEVVDDEPWAILPNETLTITPDDQQMAWYDRITADSPYKRDLRDGGR
jgi:hypothetical protein